ncbi:MAG: hypothetical protein Kow0069_07590 [Promethearchaeota archaeon]
MDAKRVAWLLVHGAIIAHFVAGFLYAGWMVFALAPEGHVGPLFGAAADVDLELFLKRRLYALESWLIFVGLVVYLALTEVLPRKLRATAAPRDPAPISTSDATADAGATA